jgi:nitrogen regulatory protein P-II 1
MKEIKAVIQPHKLARLRAALFALPGFNGMTVSRVEGMSRPGGPGEQAASAPRSIKQELTDYSGKVLITIVAEDAVAEAIATAICDATTTGQKGDGLVWIIPVDSVFRIRDAKPGP